MTRLDEEVKAILTQYEGEWNGAFERAEGGWNNTTRLLRQAGGGVVLRIYETHRDRAKIEFEHEVLLLLSGQKLPFRIPVPVKTRSGETLVELSDGSGRYACLFEYIEGEQVSDPSPMLDYAFGEAAARLSKALVAVSPAGTPAYPPYYELTAAYPECTPERVASFCRQPPAPFAALSEPLDRLGRLYTDLPGQLGALRRLPHQLVHGDLNYSNLLAVAGGGQRVAALLDFEFCTWDVRAMEAAVAISGLFKGEDEGREAVRQFCRGFGGQLRMAREEADAIPALMRLRKLDVFLHFLTRYWNGIDGADPLIRQIGQQAAELDRLERNMPWLIETVMEEMPEKLEKP